MPNVAGAHRVTRILLGVARNPAAPSDAVRRLIRSPALAEQVAWRRTDIPDGLAQTILDSGHLPAAEFLGLNDALPTRIRWRLATHPSPTVRAAAAGHAVPERVRPGCEVPPALLAHLASDPDPLVRARVAEHSATPDEVRAGLAADREPSVRKTVAERWTQAPDAVRRCLLTDPDPEVRAAALSPWHSPPPPELHADLLGHDATRHLVLPYIRLTPDAAAELAASPDDMVRAALAAHPGLPPSTRERLAHDPEVVVRVYLVTNPATPEGLRTQILAGLDAEQGPANGFLIPYFLRNAWRDKASLGWLWEAPLAERLAYLDSPHAFFREAIAASADLPQHAINRLLADPDVQVRRILAKTHDVPGDALEGLVRDHGDSMHLLPLLVERPTFPRSAFADFAVSDQTRLRRLALHDKQLPAHLVGRLAVDSDPYIRRAAAEHPNLPDRCLATLLTDSDLNVAEATGAAPGLPREWVHQLLALAGL
ncbi:MAG TPA: HEAT repeat domain-containing protein [Pilimelia sp.]|nr:HEAT repeat domain-containing protein [Pilimelia sp.]